ncbi:GlxA family transcriptional regulator [Pedobacter caeni]|uniref:Transcriptional regulator GlxA family, contains an amidase domain and an AraC-type DNA-binding HTH domain n=1 Tax=Pedobacter caeni TaxID=288992 RepID=A0A1M5I241_9SPHI|nr:helix-turn-helix domain-containing protein [Pedobacter caeni]SHG22070.1 Transcriptional regulator GlxA family, contains an amidase domain and an AraC-type DNA-binding HTH domain [Pedobacter caeni]
MIQVALLLTNKYRLLSVAAILDVFDTVNSYYENNGEEPFFKINLIRNGNSAYEGASFEKYDSLSLNESGQQDLVLIPAFDGKDLSSSIHNNLEFLPWMQQQYKKGAELASFCTGAFLLAASGLLNGKSATTHVNASDAFASNFPDVYFKPDKVVTVDQGIYTSGGATSSFHLMLTLIHNYCNRDLAVHIAKIFAIDMNREQQSYFGTFHPVKDHGDELVAKTQVCIENAYKEAVTIEDILQQIPSSRRNIVRRFKQATGNTLIEYLQKTRIEAAKKLLEQTNFSILEIMLHSGYNDLKTFRQLFKKNSGMTPKDYRDKFKPKAA